jgi:hypothetical protein
MINEQKKAAVPHQMLIFNILVFNVFIPIFALLNDGQNWLLPASYVCSIIVVLFIGARAKTIHVTPLVNAHWHIVWRRCRILLIAYSISISIELFSGLLALLQSDPKMGQIMMIAFSRIAIVPSLLVVTPLLVMSTIAMTKVRRGKYTLPNVK